MTDKIKELLNVLDLPEEEQITWFYRRHDPKLHTIVWIAPKARFKDGMLADLAFRLRDEIVNANSKAFHDAIYKVMRKVKGNGNWATAYWGECSAKPIHWILASLIAKENLKELNIGKK